MSSTIKPLSFLWSIGILWQISCNCWTVFSLQDVKNSYNWQIIMVSIHWKKTTSNRIRNDLMIRYFEKKVPFSTWIHKNEREVFFLQHNRMQFIINIELAFWSTNRTNLHNLSISRFTLIINTRLLFFSECSTQLENAINSLKFVKEKQKQKN